MCRRGARRVCRPLPSGAPGARAATLPTNHHDRSQRACRIQSRPGAGPRPHERWRVGWTAGGAHDPEPARAGWHREPPVAGAMRGRQEQGCMEARSTSVGGPHAELRRLLGAAYGPGGRPGAPGVESRAAATILSAYARSSLSPMTDGATCAILESNIVSPLSGAFGGLAADRTLSAFGHSPVSSWGPGTPCSARRPNSHAATWRCSP
jgi:hypothetical protein